MKPLKTPLTFALEKHLEDFLVQNWKQTELGKQYDIYMNEDGEEVGRQFPSDTGPIDVLAISKDRKEWLVVELKKGRASDNVVGQILRYMGYVQELAESGQKVKGVIIAMEDDNRIRRALSMVPNIEFYRYQVTFGFLKIDINHKSLRI
jgi:restriction system protein